jgi:malonyl CoA-acyl carrier protein transacylase
MTAERSGLPEPLAAVLRRYSHRNSDLEQAVLDGSAVIDLAAMTDIEVHADRLRLSSPDGAVAEIPIELSHQSGVFDFALESGRQTVVLFAGRPAAELKQQRFDALRPYYWLTEGAEEPGSALLPLAVPGFAEVLTGILGRPELRTSHPWVRAALRALNHDQAVSEFGHNLQRASIELRRNGIDPDQQRRLDTAARIATELRRGVRPVLATRRVSRRSILRSLGVDDVESLRRVVGSGTFLAPRPGPAIDLEGLLALVDELPECAFFAALFRSDAQPLVIAPATVREATTLAHSLSRANAYLFSRETSRRMGRVVADYLPNAGRGRRIAAFFPGLGSRIFYQDLGSDLLDSGLPEVSGIYQEAARALGFPGRPEKLLLNAENLPAGRLAAQGFIGAALLVHSLALDAQLRASCERERVPVQVVGYTGESFGIITAAVAGGALSVGDGVRLGQAFTPLMLTAADGLTSDDPLVSALAGYLPEARRGRPLVPEPHHVVGVRGEPAALGEILADLARAYPAGDVEVHKRYSRRQANLYVRAGVKAGFDRFAASYPAVEVEELKAATTFLAHAERMIEVREAFDRFMDDAGIVFRTPHTPVVSNSNAGLLTTAAEVRQAILAITNEVMASQTAVETLVSLHPDAILELGPGGKSVQLLLDNEVGIPVTGYTGDAGVLVPAVRLVDALLTELDQLSAGGKSLANRHFRLLREIVQRSGADPFAAAYFEQTIGRVIANVMLRGDHERSGTSAAHQLLEIYQHTGSYAGQIDVAAGELVLTARLKKRLVGPPDQLGQVYAELTVLDASGAVSERSVDRDEQHEAVVFHFDRLPDLEYADLARHTRLLLDTQPLARQIYDQVFEGLGIEDDGFLSLTGVTTPTVEQIALSYLVYQYVLFQLLRLHRPALFRHGFYLAGSDSLGWLVALAGSGAAPLVDVVRLYVVYLRSGPGTEPAATALERLLAGLGTPDVPLISPDGNPVHARIDVEDTTRAVVSS